jgi:hypothetical protein
VKEHIFQYHSIPFHCSRCQVDFESIDARDAHQRGDVPCARQERRAREGYNETQKERLKRRSDRTKTIIQQWYDIFNVLFPGHPEPPSPYVDDELSDTAAAFQEFMAHDWEGICQPYYQERLPDALRQNEDLVRVFTTFLFEAAIARFLERQDGEYVNARYHESIDSTYQPYTSLTSTSTLEPNSIEQL